MCSLFLTWMKAMRTSRGIWRALHLLFFLTCHIPILLRVALFHYVDKWMNEARCFCNLGLPVSDFLFPWELLWKCSLPISLSLFSVRNKNSLWYRMCQLNVRVVLKASKTEQFRGKRAKCAGQRCTISDFLLTEVIIEIMSWQRICHLGESALLWLHCKLAD